MNHTLDGDKSPNRIGNNSYLVKNEHLLYFADTLIVLNLEHDISA